MITVSKSWRTAIAFLDMYERSRFNDDPITVYDRSMAVENLRKLLAQDSWIISESLDDEYTFFMLASKRMLAFHSRTVVVSQDYYISDLRGIKAVRAIERSHQALADLGVKLGVGTAVSHGHHMDTSKVLLRTLARAGWAVVGELAYRRLPRLREVGAGAPVSAAEGVVMSAKTATQRANLLYTRYRLQRIGRPHQWLHHFTPPHPVTLTLEESPYRPYKVH